MNKQAYLKMMGFQKKAIQFISGLQGGNLKKSAGVKLTPTFLKNLFHTGVMKGNKAALESLPKEIVKGVKPVEGLKQVEKESWRSYLEALEQFKRKGSAASTLEDLAGKHARAILGDDFIRRLLSTEFKNYR